MQDYVVDWGVQETMKAKIMDTESKSMDLLQKVQSKAEELLAAWASPTASGVYHDRQLEWNAAMGKIHQALNTFSTNMGIAAKTAEDTESANAKALGA
ncbi:WXG100 family type VII secretion target [Blastococcus sp. Marseille-P5729]|uniref:WXG100 family type VII secretion target n=1 Tax=Blastococcus sp. Marseille-P5729 TaxID=2086582 RepID=UPI000D104999|nr:WXG100 family type VII secretion target [Blastococcus sp. Marseille-P5729]